MVAASPKFYAGFSVTPALLCFGQRVFSGFRFLLNARGGRVLGREPRGGARTQYGNNFLQALSYMERQNVLLDYHKVVVAPMTSEFEKNLLYGETDSMLAFIHP